MTTTPDHDPEIELTRQYHQMRGEADGRKAVLLLTAFEAYGKALLEQLQRAGRIAETTNAAPFTTDDIARAEAVYRWLLERQEGEKLCPGCPDCIPSNDVEPQPTGIHSETDPAQVRIDELRHYDEIGADEQMSPAVRFNAA